MADMQELAAKLNECAEKRDFEGAMKVIRANQAEIAKNLKPDAIAAALKKTTDDRILLSFVDGAAFGAAPVDESLLRLERLVGFVQGALVLNDTWGLGVVKRVDYFYRRITVDFKTKRGHQFSYAAAADMLVAAPEDHVLVIRQSDPARFSVMLP